MAASIAVLERQEKEHLTTNQEHGALSSQENTKRYSFLFVLWIEYGRRCYEWNVIYTFL